MMTSSLPLFDHQKRALAKIEGLSGRAGVFAEMGTGKTRVALAYTALAGTSRVLVVCPISVVGVWRRECQKIGYPLPIIDLTRLDSVKRRTGALAALGKGDAIVFVNYESYWRKPLRDQILNWAPDAVILDEAHRIRNRSARQTRFAHVLADKIQPRVKLALTGTPIANGLQDIWSLYRFIDQRVFDRQWMVFQNTYLNLGGFQRREIIGYRNVAQAKHLIERTSFQCRKDEVLDLPPRMDVEVPVRLDTQTRVYYDTLKRKAIVEIEGADEENHTVLARIVLTALLRLQQITGGFAGDVDGVLVDISDEKARTTAELVEDAVAEHQRCVIFCRFRHDFEKIEAALPKGIRYARIIGDQRPKDRDQVIEDFHAGKLDVVLAQIKAGSLGIDLTPANIGIFYSTGFSLDDFHQARDRLHRYGQTRHVTYYHLIAENSVDGLIYEALIKKVALAKMVTSLSYELRMEKDGTVAGGTHRQSDNYLLTGSQG